MMDSLSFLGSAMPDLSVFQFSIVDNMFSMTVAAMGAAAIFLFLSRPSVDEVYRPALMISGLVVTIACYHYFMIRHSWQDAYKLVGDGYVGTGAGFNDFYRYADWILTVPLFSARSDFPGTNGAEFLTGPARSARRGRVPDRPPWRRTPAACGTSGR